MLTIRRLGIVAVPLVFLGCGNGEAPFDEFHEEKQALSVTTPKVVKEIGDHFAARYSRADVLHSFTTEFGDDVECIPFASQPTLRRPEFVGHVPMRAPVNPVLMEQQVRTDGAIRIPADTGFRGSDQRGRLRRCPADTVPMRRPAPGELERFSSLAQMFAKSPLHAPRTGSTEFHQYVGVGQAVDNWGIMASFDIWNPAVQTGSEFSLLQISSYGGSGSGFQTVETGWHVYPNLYAGSTSTRFWIYSTNANYAAGSGCYNNTCSNFVQNPGTYCLGCALGPYSIQNGTHYYTDITTYKDLDNGSWWINKDGSWIGYYPRSNFTAIANSAAAGQWYGEIIENPGGGHTTTDMGNGVFPGAGDAAEIDWMQYFQRNTFSQLVANPTYFGGAGITDSFCVTVHGLSTSAPGVLAQTLRAPRC